MTEAMEEIEAEENVFRSCKWCRRVFYCSESHYRKYHRVKSRCWPFRVEEVESGDDQETEPPPRRRRRRLFATRLIREGELILSEASTVAAPIPHSTPVCPVCLARVRP